MSIGKEHYQRGRRFYDRKDYENALAEFDKSLTFGLRTLTVYDCKAAAQSHMERWRDHGVQTAQIMVEKFGITKDGWKAYNRLALCLKSVGLHTGASNALNTAYLALKNVADAKSRHTARMILDSTNSKIAAEQQQARARAVARGTREAKKEVYRIDRALLAAKRSQTNYIHILPRDLLVEVCHWGLVSNPNFGIAMGSVCHDWKVVVDSTPGIWSRLSLSNKKVVAKAEAWLQRSEGRVQEVEFRANFPSSEMKGVDEAMEGCLRHIRILTIYCDPTSVHNIWKGRLKGMERFTLNPPHPSRPEDQAKGLDLDLLHSKAKSLRELELWDMSIKIPIWSYDQVVAGVDTDGAGTSDAGIIEEDGGEDAVDLGWGFAVGDEVEIGDPVKGGIASDVQLRYRKVALLKLTRCCVHTPAGTRYDLLYSVPNITSIDLSSAVFFNTNEPSASPPVKPKSVQLPYLASYTETGLTTTDPIFQYLHAPSLKTFSLYSCGALGGDAAIYDQIFAPGLKLARPHLTSLDIGKCPIDHERLLEILQALPELQHLNVAFCGVRDALLEAMAGAEGVGQKVRALGLAGNDGISTTGLRIFINSRLPQTDQLAIATPAPAPKRTFAAFRPSSSQTQRKSQPTQSLGFSQFSLTESQYLRSTATPAEPPTRIDWLNLDHIERIESILVEALQKKMNFVSHNLSGVINESRIRGLGGFAWDADYGEGCPLDGMGKCGLRRKPGGKDVWYVHHGCKDYEAPLAVQ